MTNEIWSAKHPGETEDMPSEHKREREPAGEKFPDDDDEWFEEHLPRLHARVSAREKAASPQTYQLPTSAQLLIRFTASESISLRLIAQLNEFIERGWVPEKENGELVIHATLFGNKFPNIELALAEVLERIPEGRGHVIMTHQVTPPPELY